MTSPESSAARHAPTVLPQSPPRASRRFPRISQIVAMAAFVALVVGGWLAFGQQRHATPATTQRPSLSGSSVPASGNSHAAGSVLSASQLPPTLAGQAQVDDAAGHAIDVSTARGLQSHGLANVISAVYGLSGSDPTLIVAAGHARPTTLDLGSALQQAAGRSATRSEHALAGISVTCFSGQQVTVDVCVWQSSSSAVLVQGRNLDAVMSAVQTIK